MRLSEGRLRHIVIGPTAGNVATNSSPGSGKRWKVLSARGTLVTDGTVANRYLNMGLYSGSDLIGPAFNSIVCPASTTKKLALIGGSAPTGAGLSEDANGWINPDSWIIEGSDIFKTDVTAGVVGDSYSGLLTVLETYV